MAVILSNAQLAVKRKTHPAARDAHGAPVLSAEEAQYGPFRPGAIKERVDTGAEQGVEWSLRVDPEEWPMLAGDHVTEEVPDGETARVWVVSTAQLNQVVGYTAVDYVGVSAYLEHPKVP